MSWRKVKLGELVENFSVKAKNKNGSDGLEFFGVSNENGITSSKYAAEDKAEEYKIIEKGCFAYNPYRINVGSIALLNEDKKGLISPAYVVFKVKPNSIKEELLLKFLKSKEGLRQIKMYGRGTVRQALRFEDLCKIELSIPEYIEQEKLWGKLNQIDFKGNKVANEITHQLDLIKKLRQSFLREAMQGKLTEKWRKENPNIEPARELLKRVKGKKEKSLPRSRRARHIK
jgi:restriction endonuclease S subunit